MVGPCVFCLGSVFIEDYADVIACHSCLDERGIGRDDGLALLQHLDQLEETEGDQEYPAQDRNR